MKRFELALVLIASAAAASPTFAASGGMTGKPVAATATQGFMAHGTTTV